MIDNHSESEQKDESQTTFPKSKPLEMKVADAIFLKMRNSMILVKDLSNPRVHYVAFMYGSTFDLHITKESEVDTKGVSNQLFEGSRSFQEMSMCG